MPSQQYLSPQFECDLILKGGITSGIVYPPAVAELAKTHRFRQVAGTSAGAIAAALTAAAEVGRHSTTGGFGLLASLPTTLAESDAQGRTRLFRLFQAQPETRPFFDIVWDVRSTKGRARLMAVLNALRRAGSWGWLVILTVVAVILSLVAVVAGWAIAGAGTLALSLPLTVALLALALGIGFLAIVATGARKLASHAREAVDGNFHGFCNGATPSDSSDPALTPWLYDILQQLAGRNDPENEKLRKIPVTYGEVAAAGATMVTLTTNLSRGTSEQIPFREAIWAFRPDDFEKLFPEDVIAHMVAKAAPPDRPGVAEALGQEMLLLPAPEDLPIIVGTRMSLSFPILLSAVPLYGLTPVLRGDQWAIEFRPNLFSDGGITSNLPIHLFDAPLPSRPTYAINLTGGAIEAGDECTNVWRPITARQGQQPVTTSITSTVGLLGAVFDTMQNWSDNNLSRVAGFRERICTIRLGTGQGGMNLDMPPAVIESLIARGGCAGRNLASMRTGDLADTGIEVSPEAENQWDRHRWTRFRIASGGVAQLVSAAGPPFNAPGAPDSLSYRDLGDLAARPDAPLPYQSDWSGARNQDATAAWQAVLGLDGQPPERLGDGSPAGVAISFGASTKPQPVTAQPPTAGER
jgi:hypothetical protein